MTAAWQTGTTQASTIGAFFGVLICGWATNRFGYRKTLLAGLFGMIAAIFIPFFAESLPVLLIGELACGVPWGLFTVIAPSYASEIAPLPLRHICTIFVQVCWCIGGFVASGVLYGVNEMESKVSTMTSPLIELGFNRSSGPTKSRLQFSGHGPSRSFV